MQSLHFPFCKTVHRSIPFLPILKCELPQQFVMIFLINPLPFYTHRRLYTYLPSTYKQVLSIQLTGLGSVQDFWAIFQYMPDNMETHLHISLLKNKNYTAW